LRCDDRSRTCARSTLTIFSSHRDWTASSWRLHFYLSRRMQHTRSTCGPNSRGRCKVLKRSSPGGHLRSDLVSLSGPSNANAGALLRSPGPGPMVDGVAKSSSFRVSKPHRRVGVDAPHSELRNIAGFRRGRWSTRLRCVETASFYSISLPRQRNPWGCTSQRLARRTADAGRVMDQR